MSSMSLPSAMLLSDVRTSEMHFLSVSKSKMRDFPNRSSVCCRVVRLESKFAANAIVSAAMADLTAL